MRPYDLFPILAALLVLAPAGAGAPARAANDSPSVEAPIDSPEGDPLVRSTTFPASEFPLARSGRGPGALGGGITSDFVLTGELPEGDTPSDVEFTPDGSKIVVAHRDSENLVVFDAATRTFLQAIPLSGSPVGIAISPDGTRAVTANVFEDTASIVDLTTGAEIDVVAVGDQPGVVRITPDGTTAVVGNTVSGDLSVLDIASGTELRRIAGTGFVTTLSVAFEPGAIAVAFSEFELANNTTLVHPDFFAAAIHVVDIDAGTLTSLPSAASPREIAITPDGATAVVVHTSTVRRVSVVDPAAASIVKTIATGVDLWGSIAVDPTGTKAVVEVQNACRVVNLVTNGIGPAINTASVNGIETTADGNYALTIGYRGSLISYATEFLVQNLNNKVSTAIGAVSPTGPRGVMIANVFGEDMVVVNTNGAAGFREGIVPSGPPPEGDKARTAAISPDGSKAVVVSILSDNASIVDLDTRTVDAIVDVGDRPSEVEITPDGSTAVTVNLDSNFASIIDLAGASVTNVTISRRGSQVEISPDGQRAYVSVVADGDGVWRINLGTQSVEGPKLLTGNMGSVLYAFSQSSGLTLSHDGATLVTCNSFDDTISLVDTAAWAVVATVPVGDFPTRAILSADDSVIYVANRDGDTITLVSNAGAGSSVIGTAPVGQQPYQMLLAPDGDTLYVSNFQDATIGIVDLESLTMTGTVPLPNPPAGLAGNASATELYAATGTWSVSIGPGPVFSISQSGEFSVVDPASRTITDQIDTGLPPALAVYSAAAGVVGVPSPFGDGLTLIDLQGAVGVEAGPATDGSALHLAAPVPNPLTDRTVIRLVLPQPELLALSIQDVGGRTVKKLLDGPQPAGEHTVSWDGRATDGSRVAPGVYFVTARSARSREARRLVIVR